MNVFLERHGFELIFGVAATVIAICLFTTITIVNINNNNHYYAAMERCIELGATWVPNKNSGICLSPGVSVDAR
jgi:hypothetical protein